MTICHCHDGLFRAPVASKLFVVPDGVKASVRRLSNEHRALCRVETK